MSEERATYETKKQMSYYKRKAVEVIEHVNSAKSLGVKRNTDEHWFCIDKHSFEVIGNNIVVRDEKGKEQEFDVNKYLSEMVGSKLVIIKR